MPTHEIYAYPATPELCPPPPSMAARALHPSDSLLISSLPLPPFPTISYVLFKPLHNALDSIELARQSIQSSPESMLESVQLSPEPLLYIFKLTSQHSSAAAADLFATLDFPGLTRMSSALVHLFLIYLLSRCRDFILYTSICVLVSPSLSSFFSELTPSPPAYSQTLTFASPSVTSTRLFVHQLSTTL